MAHIGKLYKLQFRRDLRPSGFNDQGWAEAFLYQLSGLGGANGSLIDQHFFLCINLSKEGPPPMVWTSDPYLRSGQSFTMKVSLTEVMYKGITAFAPVIVTVNEAASGEVVKLNCTLTYNTRIDTFNSRGNPPIHLAPGYTAPFGNVGWFSPAPLWSQYQP